MDILGIVLWAIFYLKTGALKSTIPLGFRIQHGIFTLLFVGLNVSFRMIGWLLGHPDEIINHFHVSIGFLPASLVLTNEIAFTVLSAFVFFVGISLLRKKEWARKTILFIIPSYALLAPIEMLLGANKPKPIDNSLEFTVLFSLFVVASIAFHLWMFLFYKSDKTKAFFTK
jgi:hypothetical protein